eukprot:TRINITY_DN842_c0_g1_i1.p1 TRINITY_DN842_c0_g1~~TRINITY_DN842_c0_g1_i1.p1  ORF type:complete len:612 (-),score=61.77 TRINITY_DN842_c0_g1_i1:71-1906(-)
MYWEQYRAVSPYTECTRKTGLANIGNTCFMNSVIQSLGNCQCFLQDLQRIRNKIHLTELQRNFCNLMADLNSGEGVAVINPSDLIQAFLKGESFFVLGEQNDASIFLTTLLQKLEEEEFGEVVAKHFKMGMCYTSKCKCAVPKKAYSELYSISITSGTTIQQGLDNYVHHKCKCNVCKKDQELIRSFMTVPQYLVVKIEEKVEMQINEKITFSDNWYSISSIVYHEGAKTYGHVTSMIRKKDGWYECNDRRSSKYYGKSIPERNAYLVFYQLGEPEKFTIPEPTSVVSHAQRQPPYREPLKENSEILELATENQQLRTKNKDLTDKLKKKEDEYKAILVEFNSQLNHQANNMSVTEKENHQLKSEYEKLKIQNRNLEKLILQLEFELKNKEKEHNHLLQQNLEGTKYLQEHIRTLKVSMKDLKEENKSLQKKVDAYATASRKSEDKVSELQTILHQYKEANRDLVTKVHNLEIKAKINEVKRSPTETATLIREKRTQKELPMASAISRCKPPGTDFRPNNGSQAKAAVDVKRSTWRQTDSFNKRTEKVFAIGEGSGANPVPQFPVKKWYKAFQQEGSKSTSYTAIAALAFLSATTLMMLGLNTYFAQVCYN